MYIFTMPAEDWDERNPNTSYVRRLINTHVAMQIERHKLMEYYEGKHSILGDRDKANRLVCNHAKDITDTASAYFAGNPISYKSEGDITPLTDALENAGADEADGDLAQDLSIYGRAYEYIYTRQDDTSLVEKELSPENTFMVYDDTIEQNELFAVYYYVKRDSTGRRTDKYIATILTQNFKWVLEIDKMPGSAAVIEEAVPHFKGEVPIIEYLNNKLAIGDFELQIPLIDAYNTIMSDRVTDKEQFIDAILAVYGTLLTDDEEEVDPETGKLKDKKRSAMDHLRREKLLELPDGSDARYITRTFDESGMEVLRKAIEADIHKFSHVPCLTDENFSGNTSGVAMEFKLLGIENITKIKARYYKKGLRKRMRIFCTWLGLKQTTIDPTQIVPVFSRALPKNLLEISQVVNNLKGTVSQRTLLSQIPFVDNADDEIEAVQKENEQAVKMQQDMMGMTANTPPEYGENEVDKDEVEKYPSDKKKAQNKDDREPEGEKKIAGSKSESEQSPRKER